jgi:hypothetical protein
LFVCLFLFLFVGFCVQAGWEGLVDACRIMAGKTIRLLQIVYGAELKRLFAEAQQFNEGLNDLNLRQAADDPQAFADKARSVQHL